MTHTHTHTHNGQAILTGITAAVLDFLKVIITAGVYIATHLWRFVHVNVFVED